MEDEKKNGISIEGDPLTKRGLYADLTVAKSDRDTTRLDFIQLDSDGNDLGGVLVSRIVMTNRSVVALRDMLIRHTSGWEVETDGKED